MKNTYFHITMSTNLWTIQGEGLKPSRVLGAFTPALNKEIMPLPCVYLWTEFEHARNMAVNYSLSKDLCVSSYVILEVKLPFKGQLYQDEQENFYANSLVAVKSYKAIPPRYIVSFVSAYDAWLNHLQELINAFNLNELAKLRG